MISRGVLGVDPGLDGVALRTHVVLGQPEAAPLRDPELKGHEVEPGDGLGDRVLDLQPGVHLEEEELLRRPRTGDEQLDRASADVTD